MLIPIESVINFITDEGLGPYKITRSDPENWRIQINEPSAWGTNDKKWRCGIGVKQIEDEKMIVFNGFKAVAMLGPDYQGSFFKFVKLIKDTGSVNVAKQYFMSTYMKGINITELTSDGHKQQIKVVNKDIQIPDNFEKLDIKKHKEYVDYLLERKIDLDIIKKTKIYVNEDEKRIEFPVYENSNLIFFSGRDITGINPIRWKKSSGNERQPIWNYDGITTTAYVFEGVFDAINVSGGVALFGIGTESQMKKLLRLKLNKIVLIFDNDLPGRNARWRWAEWLTSKMQKGVHVYNFSGIKEKDFGSMKEHEVPFDIKDRIVFWDYRAKLLFKMGKII